MGKPSAATSGGYLWIAAGLSWRAMPYRAGCLPGRRRIRRAARVRAPRKTTIPMISRYSRPVAATPTMPSAIAAMTSSRNRAIMTSPSGAGSAAGQAPLAAGACLVGQAVMPEDRFLLAGRQLAVGIDPGGVLDQLLAEADPDVPGADRGLVQGHEGEPVPGRHPDRDGSERWLVGAGVDVDSLQLPDLAAVGVHHVVAPPLPDIGRLEHASPSFFFVFL